MLHTTNTGEVRLLAIKGNSGTGKTFLVDYLCKRLCPQEGWQTGVLDFAQSFPDFRMILDGLEDALKGCVPQQILQEYRRQREDYKRRFDEYRVTIVVTQHVEATDASSVRNVHMQANVDAELRRREAQLRAELTRALLELAEESEQPLCFIIDGYERLVETDPELVGWMWEAVLLPFAKKAAQPVLIITGGWEYPTNPVLQPFLVFDELDDFDPSHLTSYLQVRGIISSQMSSNETLIDAFFHLTKGHPFVLDLAVTYFQTLPESERSPEHLKSQQPLLDEEARVRWLDERLLNRLSDPYRTLLERGPIPRSFDQVTLQVLLRSESAEQSAESMLDDRTYGHFLQYPFINRKTAQANALLEQPTFHELTRRVRLKGLRRWHPETWQFLHQVMADYYKSLFETEQKLTSNSKIESSQDNYAEWFTEIPEQQFRAQVEFLYHAFQVKELQAEASERWQSLMAEAIMKWQREQAGPLLELVQQLVEEGEPFFQKQSEYYGVYLLWYSRFFEQEARWDEACINLQHATRIFEQGANLAKQAICLNNIGMIYSSQGQLDIALDYLQRALTVNERLNDPTDIARSFNNISGIYESQGQLETALGYLQRALTLFEQVANPAGIATSLDNIAGIYRSQGLLDKALDYHQRALTLREQEGDPAKIALSLNNIAGIYHSRGQLDIALGYLQRVRSISERVGNPTDIACSLNNIGFIYYQQGQFDVALKSHRRALALREQAGNPADIATSLNNIGMIYNGQGQFKEALDYHQRALTFFEQVGELAGIATSLNNIAGIYLSRGQLVVASDCYQRALTLFEQMGNPIDIALTCHNIASLHRRQEQWQDAIDLFMRSLELYESMGQGFEPDVVEELEELSFCCMQLGEREKGVTYFLRAQLILA